MREASFTEIAPEFRVPNEVWERLSFVLLSAVPKPKGGRPRMPDRQVIDAIVYVLRTGCQWKALPRTLGAASTEVQVLVPSDPKGGELFHLCLDKEYDSKIIRETVETWGYVGHIPKRGEGG